MPISRNGIYSNHGFLTFVSAGESFGLSEKEFGTASFNQKSWEAGIWFGEETPSYLQHNLYEDEVARTTLYLPEPILKTIKELSVKIERFYEGLDFTTLPKACFEEEVLLFLSSVSVIQNAFLGFQSSQTFPEIEGSIFFLWPELVSRVPSRTA